MTENDPSEHRIAILISGQGSNMKALVECWLAEHKNVFSCMSRTNICLVASNQPNAAGMAFAQRQGLHTEVVDHRMYDTRELFEHQLAQIIDGVRATHVLLAGFMRILGEGFVRRYQGRILNIHPSLLPAYPGLDTHAKALTAGDHYAGASVHFVTPQLDGGPVIVQARVRVEPDDTVETLSARVLIEEHKIYPQALKWVLNGDVSLSPNGCLWNGRLLREPHRLEDGQWLTD